MRQASSCVELRKLAARKSIFSDRKPLLVKLSLIVDPKVLADREQVKNKIFQKVKANRLQKEQYSALEDRLNVLQKLVLRNKRSASLQVKPLDLSKTATISLNSQSWLLTDRVLQKNNSRTEIDSVSSAAIPNRVSIPCIFYCVKNKTCKIDRSVTSEGRVIIRLKSKDAPFVYHDHEIVKKLL